MSNLDEQIRQAVISADDPLAEIERLRGLLAQLCPIDHPVDRVMWVPVEKIRPNEYNPNSVAGPEMSLLHHSISADGYTQPIVTVYDPEEDLYVIVDGFHRYWVGGQSPEITETTAGRLPVVVIDKPVTDRMASTVRHNRARGKHSVQGMSAMVFKMLEEGWEDHEICNELGMEPEELLRLKHITGFSKLFENTEYSQAWYGRNQIRAEKAWEAAQAADGDDLGALPLPAAQAVLGDVRPSLRFVVYSYESREDHGAALVDELDGADVHLYVDRPEQKRDGQFVPAKICLETYGGEDIDYLILMEDDLILSADFVDGVAAALAANADRQIVTFFSVSSEVAKARAAGKTWIRSKTISWTQCVAYPIARIPALLTYANTPTRWFDSVVSAYCLDTEGAYVYQTVPSLVQYQELPSTCGNPTRIGGKPRTSKCFGTGVGVDFVAGYGSPARSTTQKARKFYVKLIDGKHR